MENKRDIIDLSSDKDIPAENQPVTDVDRPVPPNAHFLDKFLAEKPNEEAASDEDSEKTAQKDAPIPDSVPEMQKAIIEELREIYDPEIPVNIYEMGLIYEVSVSDDYDVNVTMTLTTPNCPVAETMPGEVEMRVRGVSGVKSATVELVWDPPWDMSFMSDEARLELGLL